MIDVKETKRICREMAADKLAETSDDYRSSASVKIALNAIALPETKKAKTVMAYFSVDKEPSTLALITKLIEDGKKVCLPRCTSDGIMEARQITSLDHLELGAFGIPEPIADDKICPVIKPTRIDIVILPCVACGTDCSRLGHGAGYYDRYLDLVRGDCFKAALCYEALLLDGIPMSAEDVYMNAVITEESIYRWRP